jgi:hypothetical protein
MVSLDGRQREVKTLPNKYIFNIEEKLTPTDYQSVLSTEFVFILLDF